MNSKKQASGLAWIFLGTAALYLLLPLVAMVWSSATTPRGWTLIAYSQVLAAPDFAETFLFSVRSALITIAISAGLIVPTSYWVQLRVPRMRAVIEFLTIVPLVVPALLMTFGLIRFFNGTPLTNSANGTYVMLIGAYVILSFPYMYRSVDAGMQAINVRTLTEAAQSLGAGWGTIVGRVIFPNLFVAVLNGSFITFSIVLGEFTIASLLAQPAFTPYILTLSQQQADQATALGIISFLLTWLSVLLIQVVSRGRTRVGLAGVR